MYLEGVVIAVIRIVLHLTVVVVINVQACLDVLQEGIKRVHQPVAGVHSLLGRGCLVLLEVINHALQVIDTIQHGVVVLNLGATHVQPIHSLRLQGDELRRKHTKHGVGVVPVLRFHVLQLVKVGQPHQACRVQRIKLRAHDIAVGSRVCLCWFFRTAAAVAFVCCVRTDAECTVQPCHRKLMQQQSAGGQGFETCTGQLLQGGS